MAQIDFDRNLPLIFERPCEPIFYKKGTLRDEVVFAITPNYLLDKEKSKSDHILSAYENSEARKVQICDKSNIFSIDLNPALTVSRRELFSTFLGKHQKAAAYLIKLFMTTSREDFLPLLAYCHDRVNTQMFNYALSVCCYHRDEFRNLPIPPLSQVFPQKYFDSQALQEAKEMASLYTDENDREEIEIPFQYTGNDAGVENRLFYFREDLGINLHHWHWHLVYPSDGTPEVVTKDRRGELFYYMHHQVMARYNTERLCNGMSLTKPLILKLNYPIKEEYFSKLDSTVASRSWPGRPTHLILRNINRPADETYIEIESLVRFRERILLAIHEGSVVDENGQSISLRNNQGIDILGDMIEASILSVNRQLYGSIHNNGHMAIAYIHDPEGTNDEFFAVMGDSATAMRDPVFYRWHGMIDQIFLEHKNTLPPYTKSELELPLVSINSIVLHSKSAEKSRTEQNIIRTFWSRDVVNLARGLDFAPRGAINARITHLDHHEFMYKITCQNSNASQMKGTCRIFIAPKLTLRRAVMPFVQQKELMIEMDKFEVTLKPGKNNIIRKSTESAVTIPYESTFRDLSQIPENAPESERLAFDFCGCGWPQHMLIPRGTVNGFRMDLFCMISDIRLDRVEQTQEADPSDCRTGVSFCGLRNQRYPDGRPMGFPFDRPLPTGVDSLSSFVANYKNMKTTTVTIQFDDRVLENNPRQVQENIM